MSPCPVDPIPLSSFECVYFPLFSHVKILILPPDLSSFLPSLSNPFFSWIHMRFVKIKSDCVFLCGYIPSVAPYCPQDKCFIWLTVFHAHHPLSSNHTHYLQLHHPLSPRCTHYLKFSLNTPGAYLWGLYICCFFVLECACPTYHYCVLQISKQASSET